MPGPLDGYRIVDLTAMVSGPVATMMLADQGAEVIKVEPPAGDLVRRMGHDLGGVTSSFVSANRSKKSVVLDLKSDRARTLLDRLVASADVFVQNFRPGTVERMGIGEDAIRALRPDIVYVSISGFGERGPYRHKRVYDPVIQALSGLADIQTDRETGRPMMIRTIIPDKVTALTAAQAITAALLHRERTGEGQHVRLAMLDAMVAFLWPEGLVNLTVVDRELPEPRSRLAPDLIYRTRDGYITVGAVSDSEWQGLCAALERPDWLTHERFATPHLRTVNVVERLEQTQQVLLARTTAEWLERLDSHQVPCAPVLAQHELADHPQIVANELVEMREHPEMGPYRQARPAARFEGSPSGIAGHAPRLGEHTREVLARLGLDTSEIDALYAERAVA